MRFSVAILLTALGTAVGHVPAAEPPKAEAHGAASLTVMHEGNYTEKLALVTLYHDGQPVRSAELEQGSPDRKKVAWDRLPPGLYEVHFEAAGFKKFVKRVVLADAGPEVNLRVQLDMGTSHTLGAGPSTQQLETEIAQLKREQAALKKIVDQLQSEVSRSKK